MISHARVTSAKNATVQFSDRTQSITGQTRNEVRTAIKQAFIDEARAKGSPIDVVIFDGTAKHSLRVEPNGRIQPRPDDDRPLYPSSPVMPKANTQAASASSADSEAFFMSNARSASSAASAASANFEEPQDSPKASEIESKKAGQANKNSQANKSGQAGKEPLRTASSDLPTLHDLRQGNEAHRKQLATRGFNKFVRHASLGVIRLGPGKSERDEINRIARIRKQLDAPKNIAVVNLKGGAHKTTSVLMLAATLGMIRGGSVLAWDNNETRGTLGWRGIPTTHNLTALDLSKNLDHFASGQAQVADLDRYVRHQGDMNFDILASDEDPGSAASIDGEVFQKLNETLSRFYRIKVVDTGNNVRASNWLAAVEGADQLVIVSTIREDTFNSAAWMIDELRMTGHASQVENAVTILSHSSAEKLDNVLRKRLVHHFGAHTRAVLEVPFEKHFVEGGSLEWSKLTPQTRQAWLEATATVVDGL